jgi:AraC family transcriptional regulator of adaptative response/methylated-DNA-[protein]-cysteine methyltransferase
MREPNGSLARLSKHVGLSPFHLHRVFKALTGLTPRQFASAARAERVRRALPKASSVTEAMYSAGFNSASSFYAQAKQVLGMSPSAYRRGAKETTLRHALEPSTLGWVLVAASEQGVCAISLGPEPTALLAELQRRFGASQLAPGDPEFCDWVARAVALVEGARDVDLPLDVRGTVFQQRVWQLLREIPAGETRTYSELSRALGAPNGARAVARACADNPLAVAVPCHRVVRSDGSLAGYRWGLERKAQLLRRERD